MGMPDMADTVTLWAMPDTDTVTDMAMDTTWAMPDMVDMATTARGPLMPSPRPRLMPILTTMVDTTAVDIMDMADMDTMDTMAMDMDMAVDTDMAMATATTVKSSFSYLLQTQHQQ